MNPEENQKDINSIRQRTYRTHLERKPSRRNSYPIQEQNKESGLENEPAEIDEYTSAPIRVPESDSIPIPQKTQRISAVTATLLVWLALFFDGSQFLLNLIPILGNLLSVIFGFFAWLSFYVWLKTKGVEFSGIKKGGTLIGAAIIELFPVVNAIPAWTFAILILIAVTKSEDTTGIKIPKKRSP